MKTWEIRDGNGRHESFMSGTEAQAKRAAATALLVGSYREVSASEVQDMERARAEYDAEMAVGAN
jgi:hypothetical protein